MKLSLTDQIIVVAYLAAIMIIGFAMKRRASKVMSSYFLGGRRLPWWALDMSGSSSYFDISAARFPEYVAVNCVEAVMRIHKGDQVPVRNVMPTIPMTAEMLPRFYPQIDGVWTPDFKAI
jgi:hypothetical protein